MAKKTISRMEYYQLTGLFVHHARLEAQRHEVEKTVAEIVGEEPDEHSDEYYGHVSDSLMEKTTVNEMLNRLNIRIVGPFSKELEDV